MKNEVNKSSQLAHFNGVIEKKEKIDLNCKKNPTINQSKKKSAQTGTKPPCAPTHNKDIAVRNKNVIVYICRS